MANIVSEKGPAVENGGVLWGRVRDTGENYYIVTIEQADLLDCEHERGEGWALSEADRRKLKKRLKQNNGDLQPVGYWRSHRRLGLYLDKRDADLIATYFPQPWSVALCVRPPSTAGFFIWEQGEMRRTSSYREFQLPGAAQPAPAPLPRILPRWRKWTAAAAIAAALAVTPLLIRSKGSSGSAFNMLSMKADTKPGLVRLRWDPRSKVLAGAQGAIIWIADGPEESKLELTPEQVRSGSIEYKPAGNDVNFRMQVGQFTESLRIQNATPGETRIEQAEVAAPDPIQPVDPPQPEPKPRRAKPARAVARAMDFSNPAEPSTRSRSADVDAPPEPPQLAFAPPSKFENRPPLPSRDLDVPRVSATVEKPRSTPLKRVFGWMIPRRKKDFVPAKVVRQFQPHVKANEPVSVAVRVSIDPKGVVHDADLLTKGVDDNLGLSAVEAAKRWKFEPARLEDRPVASDLVVRFQFGAAR
jgi:TonB family protein